MASLPLLDPEVFNRAELARRWKLAREAADGTARAPRVGLLLGEFLWPLHIARRSLGGAAAVKQARRPRTVMLLPGFGAHPVRMRWMAQRLEAAGHTVKRWGEGINLGATEARFRAVEARLVALHEREGAPLDLVGWSLGGVFARELAKAHPDKVAKVITLGSPFSGNPRANNGWRAYQAIAGHRVDEPQFEAQPHEKPACETVALWSPRDGIVHPRAARGRPGERDRARMLRCTHMGFVLSHEAVAAVLEELDAG